MEEAASGKDSEETNLDITLEEIIEKEKVATAYKMITRKLKRQQRRSTATKTWSVNSLLCFELKTGSPKRPRVTLPELFPVKKAGMLAYFSRVEPDKLFIADRFLSYICFQHC